MKPDTNRDNGRMAIAAKPTLAGCLRQDKLIAFPANFAFILREPIAFAVGGYPGNAPWRGGSLRVRDMLSSVYPQKKIFIDGSAKKIKKFCYPCIVNTFPQFTLTVWAFFVLTQTAIQAILKVC